MSTFRPSGEESTRFLLNLPRHNQLVSGEHNSPPNPDQRTPLAGGVPHTCAPLFLLSKWLLMTWLSRSRSFSDDIATSLMIKFWGNENSKSLIALDCPAKWWVHCCGYPRWENAPLNVQKPFLVCNGPITSIFPDFKKNGFGGHENVRFFENQLFQAATRIFGTMLVHPPLFGNTASKLPVKKCKIFFWPRLFFYVLPAKNSSCKTAVNDIQFCSKWPTRRGHRPNGVNQPPRLQKINPNVRLVPFLAPFTWFWGLTRRQHWPRANWVLKNVENHSKIPPEQ